MTKRPLYFEDIPVILDLCVQYADVMEPNLLATVYSAVVERETRWGVISKQGRYIIGDSGHGHFLPQIDDRWHTQWLKDHPKPTAEEMHAKGLDVLVLGLRYFKARGVSDWVLRGVCAYNAGTYNVEHAANPDLVTTGKDYGRDVLYTSFLLISGLTDWTP